MFSILYMMAFLSFPFTFTEVDELLDKEINYNGDLSINTKTIVSYNASRDKRSTIVRLIDGESYILPVTLDCFEDLLQDTEDIIDLSDISVN